MNNITLWHKANNLLIRADFVILSINTDRTVNLIAGYLPSNGTEEYGFAST